MVKNMFSNDKSIHPRLRRPFVLFYQAVAVIKNWALIVLRKVSDYCISKLAKDEQGFGSESETDPYMDYIVENTLPLSEPVVDPGTRILMVGYLPNRSAGYGTEVNSNRFGTVYVMKDGSRTITPHRGSLKLKLAQLLLTKYDDDGNIVTPVEPKILDDNYYHDDDGSPTHGLT